jgi:hypothetical protein
MADIDHALTELDRLCWTRYIMARLSGLHRQHGSPARQKNAMNQELKALPFISYAKVGQLAGYEQEAVVAYNNAVKLAYACIGWEFVGLCSARVYGSPKTKAPWDEYVRDGEASLNAYFGTAEAFDDFDAYILEPARGVLGI